MRIEPVPFVPRFGSEKSEPQSKLESSSVVDPYDLDVQVSKEQQSGKPIRQTDSNGCTVSCETCGCTVSCDTCGCTG